MYRVRARKELSQNFLLDERVARKFVRSAGALDGCHVIEVGPGPGSLTRAIVDGTHGDGVDGVPARLTVVEKDSRFIPFLTQLAESAPCPVDVVQGDILKFDYGSVLDDATLPVRIIGNLPFSIATPLLFSYLKMARAHEGPFRHGPAELSLCFQKEVADRIIEPAGGKVRSRISVMAQHVCATSIVYDLPRSVFVPRPNVDAAVVRLVPLAEPVPVPYKELDVVVNRLFMARRKTIRNNLLSSDTISHEVVDVVLEAAGLDPLLRPQQLDLTQIHALHTVLKRMNLHEL
jgi:dimethyladenosine transferase 1